MKAAILLVRIGPLKLRNNLIVAPMAGAFPDAPLFTSAADRERLLSPLDQRDITTSWLDRTPGLRRQEVAR